jgi:hypothetical protein
MKNKNLNDGTIILFIFNFFIILFLLVGLALFDSFKIESVVPYILILLPSSYFSKEVLFKKKFGIFSDYNNIKRNIILILGSSLVIYFFTVIFSKVTLGSVYVTLVISLVSGFFVFIILKDKKISKSISQPQTKRIEIHLFLIFLLAFSIRFLVFGTSKVPLGYDTPVYLIQAMEGFGLKLSDAFSRLFHISSNVHKDTWLVSEVWLGYSYKILNFFDLEPEYVAKIIIPLISSLSVFPIYLIAKDLTNNDKIALFAATSLALMPSELLFSHLYKEILGEFFLLCSLFLVIKTFRGGLFWTIFGLAFSTFLLWKIAVTAFAKFVLFSCSVYSYYFFNKKIRIGKIKTIFILLFFTLVFILLKSKILLTFPSFSPVRVSENVYPSQRFSFGLISIIDLIPFMIFFFYLTKTYFSPKILEIEKNVFSFSLIIFMDLFFFSFVLGALGGYRIFPSSSFLNTLRFSLYLSIPFSLVCGLFLYDISISRLNKINLKLGFFLFGMIVTSLLTGNVSTTLAPGHFNKTISEEVYGTIDSLDYSGYDGVVVLGDFRRDFDNIDYSFGNWVRYLVIKNSGREPILIKNTSELDKLSIEAKNYLFLNLSNKRVNDMRSLKEG